MAKDLVGDVSPLDVSPLLAILNSVVWLKFTSNYSYNRNLSLTGGTLNFVRPKERAKHQYTKRSLQNTFLKVVLKVSKLLIIFLST